MKVKDIVNLIETIAPREYQESYDNAGLIIGHLEQEITSVLCCLDSTEAVVDEAIEKGCHLILAHHPLIFKGIKRINGNNDVERVIIKAIQHHIAIYAAHTNLDNVYIKGVNQKLAGKIGLQSLKILQQKANQLVKIQIYTPKEQAEAIQEVLFNAGAGSIGLYTECSFTSSGTATFKPGETSKPFTGSVGLRETAPEFRIESIAPAHLGKSIIEQVRLVHPYEEMAYEIIPLLNDDQHIGSGMVGELPQPMNSADFLQHLKTSLGLDVIKYTPFSGSISKVAICGGSGSFLLGAAMGCGADAYVTADVKYHEFFDAEGRLMFCDIGHYESEISTLEVFSEVIHEKYPTFAVIFCNHSTNPIQYYK